MRLRLQQEQEKHAQLQRKLAETQKQLEQSAYENRQLSEQVRQQKVYFDEYHTKVTQTIQQIESENQLLKKENKEMANLKQ